MKKIVSIIAVMAILAAVGAMFAGCDLNYTPPSNGSKQDVVNTIEAANILQENQPTPTDIEYSLERYNLIRRTYWVNGQREKADALPCEVEKPLSYIVLFSGNVIVGNFVVDGKISSLNSFLTPDSEYYEMNGSTSRDSYGNYSYKNKWLADVDGSYGENDSGIFFFTPDGTYIEWSGVYLYSDIPFEVDALVLSIAGGN